MIKMNLFEEIDNQKKDLPRVSGIAKSVGKYKYNVYQILAFVLFFISLILGLVLGNLFPVCGSSSSFYGDYCVVTEFNVILMLAIWFIGFLISVIFFAIGHVIFILNSINEKL